MKKIKIEKITNKDKKSVFTKDRKYSVYLGTTTIFNSSKKTTKRQLVELNVQLNNILLELNNIYINIFIEYRKVAVIYNEHFYYDSSCSDIIQSLEKFFIKAITPASPENRNYFFVSNLTRLTETLSDLAEEIITVYVKKRHFVECSYMRSVKRRLEQIKQYMEEFGKDEDYKSKSSV
jgi:hypothetical protein